MIRRESALIADSLKSRGGWSNGSCSRRTWRIRRRSWRSCSRRGMCSSRFARWPRTAAQPTGGWHDWSTSYLMLHPPLFADIADQFDVIKTMADGQREFLHRRYRVLPNADLHAFDDSGPEISIDWSPTKRGHAPDHRVGRDRCRANGSDRLFRSERALPRLCGYRGFIASAVIIIILAAVLFIIFKRKGWLRHRLVSMSGRYDDHRR